MVEVAEKAGALTEQKKSGRAEMTRQVTENGTTTISSSVVAKVAGIAAREVSGVHRLVTEGVGAAVSGLASRVMGADPRGRGVQVEVGQREAAVDLALEVDYGVNIAKVCDAVRANIMERVHGMTGLVVKEVNILVSDLYFPEEEVEEVVQPRRVV